MRDYLKNKAHEFNIELNDEQLNKFEKFYEILNEFNQHTNLISNSEREEVFKKHFVDSLALGLENKYFENKEQINIIDIGIGGGFPGIPLLIAYPNFHLFAVDSVGKKIKFLEMLAKELKIEDRTEFFNGRAEEIGTKYRNYFDIAVTRAVAHLSVISEYTLPFVKTDGIFVAYKAKTTEDELNESQNALKLLGGEFMHKTPYELTESEEYSRNLIVISKIEKTESIYPRKTGIPKKMPL